MGSIYLTKEEVNAGWVRFWNKNEVKFFVKDRYGNFIRDENGHLIAVRKKTQRVIPERLDYDFGREKKADT